MPLLVVLVWWALVIGAALPLASVVAAGGLLSFWLLGLAAALVGAVVAALWAPVRASSAP